MKIAGPVLPRFEAKVEKTDGCWRWLGAKHGKGYGHFKMPTGKGDGRIEKAHRTAYNLYVGEIPDGLMVLHRCDNPSCVNPDHLFLGTNDDNMKDMVAKGRGNGPRGEEQHFARLTEQAVESIRSSGKSGVALAAQHKVSPATISDVRNRKTWRHI